MNECTTICILHSDNHCHMYLNIEDFVLNKLRIYIMKRLQNNMSVPLLVRNVAFRLSFSNRRALIIVSSGISCLLSD